MKRTNTDDKMVFLKDAEGMPFRLVKAVDSKTNLSMLQTAYCLENLMRINVSHSIQDDRQRLNYESKYQFAYYVGIFGLAGTMFSFMTENGLLIGAILGALFGLILFVASKKEPMAQIGLVFSDSTVPALQVTVLSLQVNEAEYSILQNLCERNASNAMNLDKTKPARTLMEYDDKAYQVVVEKRRNNEIAANLLMAFSFMVLIGFTFFFEMVFMGNPTQGTLTHQLEQPMFEVLKITRYLVLTALILIIFKLTKVSTKSANAFLKSYEIKPTLNKA